MKLSVIIPCYKVEKYLDRCMQSVVNQSYQDLEIILVDDGSPDSTGAMCDEWAKRDNRIKVVHKQNGGLGFARNSGLEIATGDFVAFIDSDDYVDVNMYSRLMKRVEKDGSDIVFCGHIKQLSNGTSVEVCDFKNLAVFEKSSLLTLSQGFFRPTSINPSMLTMSVWHAVYRRSVISQLFHSEREVGSEDIHFQVCAMLNSNRVTFIPDPLYIYCYNGESLSHEFKVERYERYKLLNKILNETYAEHGVERPADYCVFIMAFAQIRNVEMSALPRKEKDKYYRQIVEDKFWDSDNVDYSQLDIPKKLFYNILKAHSVSMMKLMARLYCFMFYTLAKKGRI